MSKDEKIEEQIAIIRILSKNWLEYVKKMGNQCAYTDSGVEEIIKAGKELEVIYNDRDN